MRPGPKGGERTEILIAEQRTGVARAAPGLAEEQVHTAPLPQVQSTGVAGQKGVERAVCALPFNRHKGRQRIGDLGDCHILWCVDMVKRIDEGLPVFRDDPHPLGQDRPACVDPVVDRARDLVFLGISGHFELGGEREYRLRRQQRIQPRRQPFLGGRVDAVAIGVGARQPPVVKQDVYLFCAKIP